MSTPNLKVYANAKEWFQEHRLAWIRENATIFGFVGRQHIMRKFNVSELMANDDLLRAKARYSTLARFLTPQPLPIAAAKPAKKAKPAAPTKKAAPAKKAKPAVKPKRAAKPAEVEAEPGPAAAEPRVYENA